MENLYVIGDIAGQYDALMRLISRLPKDAQLISVGDLIDRGPKSYEVVRFFMDNPQHTVIKANHEDLFIDWAEGIGYYPVGCWHGNGGQHTIVSFYKNGVNLNIENQAKPYADWMKSRPLTLETPNLFVSHAFFAFWMSIKGMGPENYGGYAIEESIIWNRSPPMPMRDKYQICGHNSQFGLRTWHDEGGAPYATCIDDSRRSVLTAIHFPSLEVTQEPY